MKYAKAISRQYAPDARALESALERYRAAEARAFAEHQRAFSRFVEQQDLLGAQGLERFFWRALAA